MKDLLLCKPGEIFLKGLNKHYFEERLVANVKRRLKPIGHFRVTYLQSALYIEAADRPHANHRDHRIGQEDREQKQRERRDEARALAMDIAARQVAGAPGEQRQRVPDLALEMKDRVDQIVPDRAKAAMDIATLAAMVAVRSDQAGAAIQAASRIMAGRAAPMARFDRARRQPRGHCRPDPFDIPAHAP